MWLPTWLPVRSMCVCVCRVRSRLHGGVRVRVKNFRMLLKACFAAARYMTVFHSSIALATICPKVLTMCTPCGVVRLHVLPVEDYALIVVALADGVARLAGQLLDSLPPLCDIFVPGEEYSVTCPYESGKSLSVDLQSPVVRFHFPPTCAARAPERASLCAISRGLPF